MESMRPDGSAMPSVGTLSVFEPPAGPGVRVDTFGYAGYKTSPRYDSLLAKVIAWTPQQRFEEAVGRAYRALSEFRLQGVRTNIPFLQSILCHPDFREGRLYTGFIDDHLAALAGAGAPIHRRLFVEPAPPEPAGNGADQPQAVAETGRAGVRVDPSDPLAVLAYGKSAAARPTAAPSTTPALPAGAAASAAPDGTVAVE